MIFSDALQTAWRVAWLYRFVCLAGVITFFTPLADAYESVSVAPQPVVVEGDILSWNTSGRRSVAVAQDTQLWPDGIIPYRIAPDLPANSVAIVQEAIDYWNRVSAISFQPLAEASIIAQSGAQIVQDSVLFQVGEGCASWVGRRGGVQEVWVAANCTVGSLMHEIGHILGLEHEHTRADRDNYIRINWENIAPDKRHNFNVAPAGAREFGYYDYSSIMHYGPYNFSAEGKPTITPLYSTVDAIGQRLSPSPGDLSAIAELYATDLSISTRWYPSDSGSQLEVYLDNLNNQGAHDIAVHISADVADVIAYSDNGWICEEQSEKLGCSLERLAANASTLLLLDMTTQPDDNLLVTVRSKTPDQNQLNNSNVHDPNAASSETRYQDDSPDTRLAGGISGFWWLLLLVLLHRQTGLGVDRSTCHRIKCLRPGNSAG